MQPPFTLTRQQVRDLDRRAMQEYGIPGIVLMENAGRGCAEMLMRLNPEKTPTVILCGPGNNGGDGFVMARHLDNAGWPVEVCLFAERGGVQSRWRLSMDAAMNCSIWDAYQSTMKFDTLEGWEPHRAATLGSVLEANEWVVDALFGTGLSRRLESPFSDLVQLLNRSKLPVLAVDLPSGLDCDTGEPLGPTVRATHTATFVAPKRGFLNPNSREWTGEVHVIDIGAPRKLVDEYRTPGTGNAVTG